MSQWKLKGNPFALKPNNRLDGGGSLHMCYARLHKHWRGEALVYSRTGRRETPVYHCLANICSTLTHAQTRAQAHTRHTHTYPQPPVQKSRSYSTVAAPAHQRTKGTVAFAQFRLRHSTVKHGLIQRGSPTFSRTPSPPQSPTTPEATPNVASAAFDEHGETMAPHELGWSARALAPSASRGGVPSRPSPVGFFFLKKIAWMAFVTCAFWCILRHEAFLNRRQHSRPTQQNASSVLPLCWSVVGNFSKADTYSGVYSRAANILCTNVLHNVRNIWLCIWDRLQQSCHTGKGLPTWQRVSGPLKERGTMWIVSSSV